MKNSPYTVQRFLNEWLRFKNPTQPNSDKEPFDPEFFSVWQSFDMHRTADFETVKAWAFENLRYDFHTSGNQTILRRMLDREDFYNQTGLVEHLLDLDVDGFSRDNIEGGDFYRCDLSDGEFYGTAEERDEKVEELEKRLESLKQTLIGWVNEEQKEEAASKLEDDIYQLENADLDNPEIYEWWLCSSWMIRRLKQQGEMILETDFETWWGRQTTGQALVLDNVFAEIAFEMEILEFQANDWSKK